MIIKNRTSNEKVAVTSNVVERYQLRVWWSPIINYQYNIKVFQILENLKWYVQVWLGSQL